MRALAAIVVLVVAGNADARGTRRPPQGGARVRTLLLSALSARAAWSRPHAPAGAAAIAVPAPSPAPSLGGVLPPGLLAALVAGATQRGPPHVATDGLSWRELRPVDESGRRIVPLAFGRF